MCLPKSNRYDKQLVNAQRYSLLDWWNKESLIWKTYLKYFSMEKYIGVRQKEYVLNHPTPPINLAYVS
jgi:hypothetical protein